MFIGTLLVAFGVLLLLSELGIIYGSVWHYLWPVALIALGFDFIFKDRRRKH